MKDLPEETWPDGEGPQCPFCGAFLTADGPEFYDERGFETECNCGGTISIQPSTWTSWNTKAIRRNAPLAPL